jgi:NADPH2:quinone reductase
MTYKAHVCTHYGEPRELVIKVLNAPEPGPAEVVIRNRAFTIGFPDLLTIQGQYQRKPTCPFVPGSEFSGEIASVGADVSNFRPGDMVMGSVLLGAYAERVLARAEQCLALPKAFDFARGAAFQVAYKTAYVALVERGNLQPGETVLVLGAAGGVGLAAVELAKVLGAQVIAAASTDEKLKIASSMGADYEINYASGEFSQRVKELTQGRGADIIFDPVGGNCFDEAMHCIAPFGRLLVIGFASGRIPTFAVNYALIKQVSIVGVRAGEFGRLDPEAGQRVTRALMHLAENGKLHPSVHQRFPFNGVAAAFAAMQARAINGRAVVEC